MDSVTDVDDNLSIEQHTSKTSQKNYCIKKIYPSKSELSIINNSVKCTEGGCHEIFTSYSNLNLHLYKTHNKKDAIRFESVIKHFHCPENQCIYHQSQWFKNKKLLKQHYLKVHSPKTYICDNCHEGFPTKAFKNMHVDYCGVKFKCNECPISYPKYESLLTHARRKEHIINDKIYFKLKKSNNSVIVHNSKSDSNRLGKVRPILPKSAGSVQLITNPKTYSKKSDQSIQTDYISLKLKSRITQINGDSLKLSRDNKQQSQAGLWKEQSSIESQTIGDSFELKRVECGIGKKFFTAQSSTQTGVKRSSSSTQTLKQSIEDDFSATTDTINTDTSDLIENNLENFDTNFFNCNMETQTDSIFNEDLFVYGDYYSNMYTQTCEDLFLNSLELNHIETQTVDDMLKSVEIQTMPHRRAQINCRDTSHMETQTDMEFKQILEAINA